MGRAPRVRAAPLGYCTGRGGVEAEGSPAIRASGGVVLIARRIVFSLLRRIDSGQLTVVEDGQRFVFGSGCPQASVVVRSPSLWPCLARGGRGLGEAYVDGLWDSPDLTAVFQV